MIRCRTIEEYHNIFGTEKMAFLWQEYLIEAKTVWNNIDKYDLEQKRLKFHNWRSSSLVFGMEKFAKICTKLEEDILKKRFEQLPKQINDCRLCFETSIAQVKDIMEKFDE